MNGTAYNTILRTIRPLLPGGAHAVIDRLDELALRPGALAESLGGEQRARELCHYLAQAMHAVAWCVSTGRVSDPCVAVALRDGDARLRLDCAFALVQAGLKVMGDASALMNALWNHACHLPGSGLVERGRAVLPRGYTSPKKLEKMRTATQDRFEAYYGRTA